MVGLSFCTNCKAFRCAGWRMVRQGGIWREKRCRKCGHLLIRKTLEPLAEKDKVAWFDRKEETDEKG